MHLPMSADTARVLLVILMSRIRSLMTIDDNEDHDNDDPDVNGIK